MYRNIHYNYKTSEIELFTWNNKGDRIREKHKFEPYFYTETANNPDSYSIFGGKLKKHTFKNEFDKKHSIKTGKIERVYGNLPPEQRFLIDKYCKDVKQEYFSQNPLSIFYLDIEVYSPDEFPNEWEAKHPINVITIYNSLKNEFRVFTLKKEFNPNNLSKENKQFYDSIVDKSKIIITNHSTEKELLSSFINYWSVDYPDIITGWNLPFDIPYIINRIPKLMSQQNCYRLSPLGQVKPIERQKKMGAQYSQTVKDFLIYGITTLDYQDIYMKFNIKPIPNRKLDTILELELEKGKVEYESSNLAKLSEEDWDLFVYYNIEDVNGIKKLEEKLKFLQIARMLAYMGLVPLKKALDTLPIVNGYCAVNALEENKIIPTYEKHNITWKKFDGAFVKEPIPDVYDSIVSFDLNSLYPMTMITLNISPETKFGKILEIRGNKVRIEDNVGKETILSKENFDKIIKKNNIAVSKSNVLFTQHKKGIFPKLVEEVYNKRLDDKSKINKNKKLLQNKDIDFNLRSQLEAENVFLDVSQYARKIFINSTYGYCGNKYAAMSDLDMAESVTLTCQDVIKKSSDILNDIVNKLVGEELKNEPVKYNDTDSVYLSIADILKKYNINFYDSSNDKVNNKIVNLCGSIEDKLNKSIKEWGKNTLNSIDCRFEFKMEAIADRAFFIKKKNYILHILNDEGFHVEKPEKRWKYKGIKLVSAGMPDKLKPIIKNIAHELVLNKNQIIVDEKYIEAYEKFKSLSCDDIALIKSINKFNDYVRDCNDWNVAPRMQANYRGAYYYNKIIQDLNIENKYAKIVQSDKVKYLYLKSNNKYGINVISYIDQYPKEFEELFQIDEMLMFEKAVKDVVAQFYTALDWNILSPNKQAKINILNEFLA